jgi:hypothetical protein
MLYRSALYRGYYLSTRFSCASSRSSYHASVGGLGTRKSKTKAFEHVMHKMPLMLWWESAQTEQNSLMEFNRMFNW